MARNRALQYVPISRTSWTGMIKPWTAGNESLHQEIAQEQCSHWTAKQIKAAQKQGYFDDLSKRCLKNIKLGLQDELMEEEAE